MYKYKYKYKYGFMDPRTSRVKNSLLYEQNNFTSQQGSTFYNRENSNLFFTMYPGQQIAKLESQWNDKIGSVMVGPQNRVTVYEHFDFGGRTLSLTPGFHDLPRICTRYGSRGQCLQWFDWKQKVSSIKVEPL
jgi:hypothetical protein